MSQTRASRRSVPRIRSRAWPAAVLALALGACSGGGTVVQSAPATGVPSAAHGTAVPSTPATAGPRGTGSPAPQPTASCAAPTFSAGDLGRLARVGPTSGVWVGMNLDWGSETVAEVTGRLGSPPATVVSFVSFPLTCPAVSPTATSPGCPTP